MNNQDNSNEDNRYIAAIAYLIFFIPVLMKPNSKYIRFHANQGLMLFICAIISCSVIWIPIFGSIISFIFRCILLVLVLYGIKNAIMCKELRLPIIGKLNIIKKY